MVGQWWEKWQTAAFELFTPRRKWRQERRPLAAGDVVLLRGNSKLGPDTYKLAMIKRPLPDSEGVVRSAMVAIPSRRRRGAQGMEEIRMATQRLAVLLPVEERWQGGLAEEGN